MVGPLVLNLGVIIYRYQRQLGKTRDPVTHPTVPSS